MPFCMGLGAALLVGLGLVISVAEPEDVVSNVASKAAGLCMKEAWACSAIT